MISLISVDKSTEHYGNLFISNDMLNKQFHFFTMLLDPALLQLQVEHSM